MAADGGKRAEAGGLPRRLARGALVAVPWAFAAGVTLDLWRRGAEVPVRILDFEVFRAVGRLVLEGRMAEAYDYARFAAVLRGVATEASFAPWAYPPPAGFAVAPLALGPVWAAYGAFVAATLLAWQGVVRRIAGAEATLALFALLPVALVNVFAGQNGFLTGALGGLAVLWAGRARGGVPLGLLALKPHLGVLVGAWLLMRRAWAPAGVAAAVAAGLAAAATMAFGAGVWGAWREALGETRAYMASGQFPLERMVSVYALLRSWWLPPGMAAMGHAAVALAGVLMAAATVRGRWAPRRGAAVAILGSLLLSPYLYDYDLAILGVALALALPDLPARSRLAAVALAWGAGGWGLVCTFAPQVVGTEPGSALRTALGAVALVALVAVVAGALARAERLRRAGGPG